MNPVILARILIEQVTELLELPGLQEEQRLTDGEVQERMQKSVDTINMHWEDPCD